ncbi:uncharacterized protein LOC128342701 [Hemicordylus capensis]|uniref:uncharacterized protein LOC128342701 n=1 Tax=Hemicordylus capensis TaxID=884348 RepID=UPI002303B535|nr:uncharacterized protein LOC128342701 [Hemicordylus capensis]
MVLGTFEESGVSFSKADQILLGPGEENPCREIKQKSNGDVHLLGAHTLMNKHSKDQQWAPSETSPHEEEDGISSNHDGPEMQVEHARNQWKNPSATGVAGDLCKTKTSARLPKGMGKHKCLICGKGFTRKSNLCFQKTVPCNSSTCFQHSKHELIPLGGYTSSPVCTRSERQTLASIPCSILQALSAARLCQQQVETKVSTKLCKRAVLQTLELQKCHSVMYGHWKE